MHNYENYHKVKEMIDERRANAIALAESRALELRSRSPEIAELDDELRQTSMQIMKTAVSGGDIAPIKERNLYLNAKRREAIRRLGLPEDYDTVKYTCAECGDTGWRGATMCSCLQELYSKEQTRTLSEQLDLASHSFDTFQIEYYSAQPDPKTGRSPRQNMELAYEVCLNYAQKFPSFYFKNLFLSGAPGLGKTFLSACIARSVSDRGHSVVYTSASDAFAVFEDRKFDRDTGAKDETRRYLNCDLLILDDLGCELTTALTQANLYTLINSRLVAGKRTVISSNLSPDDLRRRYTPQIASRLEGEFRPLPFFGEDIRLKPVM